jgi:hypothetical protein
MNEYQTEYLLGISMRMRSSVIRFVVSAEVVVAASAPFFFHGTVRSAVALGISFGGHLAQPVMPTSATVLFLATAVLPAVGAVRRLTCSIITAWCALNALTAFVMNFQLYTA